MYFQLCHTHYAVPRVAVVRGQGRGGRGASRRDRVPAEAGLSRPVLPVRRPAGLPRPRRRAALQKPDRLGLLSVFPPAPSSIRGGIIT